MTAAPRLGLAEELPADLVLVDGAPRPALRKVSRDAWRSLDQLHPITLDRLVPASDIVALGAGSGVVCNGSSATNAELHKQAAIADRLRVQLRWAEASDALSTAIARLPCLGEEAEASLGMRLFLLDGWTRVRQGDEAGAQASFQRALAFAPGHAWEGDLAPDPPLAFVRASQGTRLGALELGPGFLDDAALKVDGYVPSETGTRIPLAEGVHLVQILGTSVSTLEVQVEAGRTTVLIRPDRLPDDLLSHARASETRHLLGLLVENSGVDVPVWVPTNTHTWCYRPEDHLWSLAEPSPQLRARRRLQAIGVGVSLAAAGASLAYGLDLARLEGRRTIDPEQSDVWDEEWAVARTGLGASLGVLGAGVSAVMFSYTLHP